MKDIDFSIISKRIRQTRISKGLTQEFIAIQADVNPSHISNIENNREKVSLPTLIHICKAMDVTVDYILRDCYEDPSDTVDKQLLIELDKYSSDTKEILLRILPLLSELENSKR